MERDALWDAIFRSFAPGDVGIWKAYSTWFCKRNVNWFDFILLWFLKSHAYEDVLFLFASRFLIFHGGASRERNLKKQEKLLKKGEAPGGSGRKFRTKMVIAGSFEDHSLPTKRSVLTMAQILVRIWTSTCFIPYQLSWPVILPSEKFRWIAVILPLSQLINPKAYGTVFPAKTGGLFPKNGWGKKPKRRNKPPTFCGCRVSLSSIPVFP